MAKLEEAGVDSGGLQEEEGSWGGGNGCGSDGGGGEGEGGGGDGSGGGERETAERATNLLVSATPLSASPTWRRGSY